MTALASLAPLMSAGWGKTISPLFSSLRAHQAHRAHVPWGPGRKGRAGVSGKDATQLHSENSCKNTSKHGTAARKEFLQQDMARPTQGANTGVSEHSLGNSECQALCLSSPRTLDPQPCFAVHILHTTFHYFSKSREIWDFEPHSQGR